MLRTRPRAAALSAHYLQVRSFTDRLSAPLSAEDQQIQSMPDVSPTKWHRAHTTWFFEIFVLAPHVADYVEVDPVYGYLFNSYYETVGARHPRPKRGLVSRPSADQISSYRAAVDEAMVALLGTVGDDQTALLDLIELGLHHEQQHQELLLMDIKHVLSMNPTQPAYLERTQASSGEAALSGWTRFDGGAVTIGHDGTDFSFDNEGPAHEVLVAPFELANRAVTSGEWLEFMADGGYERPSLWLSDGWNAVQTEAWSAPLYWFPVDGAWQLHTLAGARPVDPAEPVCHVSLYEADAFARWAGARLPLEAEWEHAARGRKGAAAGAFAESGTFHPLAARGDGELGQLLGDVWEWTASPYSPYPGFEPAAGAVGEYNGKFMINQMVLRGGACVTPQSHIRATYRNFFPPGARWMFGGLRLARKVAA